MKFTREELQALALPLLIALALLGAGLALTWAANGALAESGYTPVRTQLPFDVTSEGTLTGDIGGADSGEAPRFTIVLARSVQ